MSHPLWRMGACVVAAVSLMGCSSVSQKWSQWRGQSTAPSAATHAAPEPLRPTASTGRWQGVYSYQADSGRFQECTSGQTVPVLMEGDNALLENAYMATRNGPTSAMLATVDGRVVERPSADPVMAQQGKKELALRVERFVSLSSAASCAGDKAAALGAGAAAGAVTAAGATDSQAAQATASLDNTYWKLLSLGGQNVPTTEREAHIILQSQGKLVGSGSCNRLMGSWKQDGTRLQFGEVAGTRMACRGEEGQIETGLLQALAKTASWRIQGERLELLDRAGKVLAMLQAVALR